MKNPKNCFDIELVEPRDPSYVAWQARMGRRTDDGRPRDPFSADYQRQLRALERILTSMTGRYCPLTDTRILRYRFENRMGVAVTAYRELDAVVLGEGGEPRCCIEIKCRENGATVGRGVGQLHESLDLLRRRWPRVKGLLLVFWTGDLLGLDTARPETLHTLEDVLRNHEDTSDGELGVYCMDARAVLDQAASLRLWDASRSEALVACRNAADAPLKHWGGGGSGSINPLGAVLEQSFGVAA